MATLRLISAFALIWLTTSSELVAQDRLLNVLRIYEFGRSPEAWQEMDRATRSSQSRDRREAEKILVELLLMRDTTPDCKILACRGLRLVAGPEGIAALLSVMTDPRLTTDARMAVTHKESKEVLDAFRSHLSTAPNAAKAGLLSSIAQAHDPLAVAPVAALINGTGSAELKYLGIRTLGLLPSEEALKELNGMSSADPAVLKARISLCDRLLTDHISPSSTAASLATLRAIAHGNGSTILRTGAITTLAKHLPEERLALTRQCLADTSGELLSAVSALFPMLDDREMAGFFSDNFPALPALSKIALLGYWQTSHGQVQLLQELSIDTNGNPELRAAAIAALNRHS